MRNIFLTVMFATFLIACRKNDLASTMVLHEMSDTTAVVAGSGNFINGPYGNVSGMATILKRHDGSLELRLSSFMSSNGPDLHVYLSRQIMPVDFVNLGKLKSIAGTQVYATSGMPDIKDYKYVCIHCKAFNHLFGYALIQ